MPYKWFRNPATIFFTAVLVALAFVVGCGGDETPTPVPTPTPTRAAVQPTPTTAPIQPAATPTKAPVQVQPTPTATLAPPPRHLETPTPTTAAVTPLPTSAPTATPVPREGVPVATRVRYGVTGAEQETNRTWNGTRQAYIQYDPMVDDLIGLDPETGGYVPELATSWKISPDLIVLTLNLRKGVQFHNKWGEFTAKDVRYSVERLCRPDSRLSTCPWLAGPKKDVPADQIVEIVDDYTVKIHHFGAGGKPAPLSFSEFVWSNASSELAIESSAHFKERGIEGLDRDGPQGTGPYQYKGRNVGQSLILEKKPEKDYLGRNPDFQEIELLWIPEDATRYATMLTGGISLADLPLDLQKDARDKKGLKLIRSRFTANNLSVFFGGMHFASIPESKAAFDPKQPWNDVKVRKAMNLAVNREELLDFLYKGIGELMYADNFHPNLEGWDPTFPERYKTAYKYNPDEARRLLKEAGYGPDNPVKVRAMSYASPQEAETPQVMEAVCTLYWAKVGIQCELVDFDSATAVKMWRTRDTIGWVWPNIIIYFPVEYYLATAYGPRGFIHHYEDDWMGEKFAEWRLTTEPKARDTLAREIGNYFFDNYVNVPLFWFRHTVAADPKVVSDWIFPGNAVPRGSHMHLLKAVKK